MSLYNAWLTELRICSCTGHNIFKSRSQKKNPHFFIIVTVVFLIGCRLENLARSYIDAYTQTPTHAHLTTSNLWAKMLHRVNLIFTISRAQSVEYNTTLTQCNAMRKFFCPMSRSQCGMCACGAHVHTCVHHACICKTCIQISDVLTLTAILALKTSVAL